MAWTTPLTAVANTALTAAQWNASVRDNLLETAVAKATASGQHFVSTGANAMAARTADVVSVIAAETTTATSYSDMATVGPTSTVTTGTKALICLYSRLSNNVAGELSYTTFSISGASTVAANDNFSLGYESGNANDTLRASACFLYTGLTSGSNAIKMQYKVSGGASTGNFADRRISVVPF